MVHALNQGLLMKSKSFIHIGYLSIRIPIYTGTVILNHLGKAKMCALEELDEILNHLINSNKNHIFFDI